jgi:hypothetical protein
MNIVEPQTPTYKLDLKNIYSDEELEHPDLKLEFLEGFDQENGGYIYNDKEKYLLIKKGDKCKIKYPLFKQNASSNGKTFKIIFKVTNCYNYDAEILSCLSDNKEIGLKINAQNAVLSLGT